MSYADWELEVEQDEVNRQKERTMSETIPQIEGDPMIEQATQFFHRMLDVIANATQLAKDVKELRLEVAKLRVETEEVRQRNMDLDNRVNALREERDTLSSELSQAKQQIETLTGDRDYHRDRANGLDGRFQQFREEHERMVNTHNEDITTVRSTLSQSEAEVVKLREQLEVAQKRFQDMEHRLWELVGTLPSVAPKEEEPKPPVQAVSNW